MKTITYPSIKASAKKKKKKSCSTFLLVSASNLALFRTSLFVYTFRYEVETEGKGNVDEETADYFMFLFARERFI